MLDANNFFHVEKRNKYSTFCASVVHNRIALLNLNVIICVWILVWNVKYVIKTFVAYKNFPGKESFSKPVPAKRIHTLDYIIIHFTEFLM